jgi:hypothetical protein
MSEVPDTLLAGIFALEGFPLALQWIVRLKVVPSLTGVLNI